jgi:hypothetical protein
MEANAKMFVFYNMTLCIGGGGGPRGLSPLANYTDRATSACQRS